MGVISRLTGFIGSIMPIWDGVSFLVGPMFIFFTMSIFPFRYPKRRKVPILLLAAALDGFALFLADYLINGTIVNVGSFAYLRVSLVSFAVIAVGTLLLYRGNKLLIALTVLLLYNLFSGLRFLFVGLFEYFLPQYSKHMLIALAILPTAAGLAVMAVIVVCIQKQALSGLSTGESWLWFAVAFLSTVLMALKCEFALEWWQSVLNAVDLMVTNGVIYFLIFLYSRQKFIASEQSKILSNMDGYKGYLEQMKELDAHISTVRHEVRNHVFYIDQLLKQQKYEELREYIDHMREQELGTRQIVTTGHAIIDSIVNAKFAYARSLGIRTDCTVRLPEEVRIDDLSLCSLLGNMLGNAIEGSQGVPEAVISLGIQDHKDYLIITVTNTVATNVIRENPHLRTTKADAENHGIGLKVVEQIVGGYGGDLRVEMRGEHTFCASAMLRNRAGSKPGEH